MIYILFFLLLISVTNACTRAEKVKCVAAAAGCGAICACDFPVCECCIPCLACITATVADCCECLFPGWSGCTDYVTSNIVKNLAVGYKNATRIQNNSCDWNNDTYPNGSYLNGKKCMNGRWY